MITNNCFLEYFCENRFSIYIGLLTTIIGAFLGFGFTLLIYYYQTKKEKQKEDQKKKIEKDQKTALILQNNKDLLNYYSELIRKVLSVVEKDLELLDDFIRKQGKELTIQQVLSRVPSYDFDRLKNIDNRGIFEAWISIFDDADKIKQYRITNSALDTLEGVLKEVYKIYDYSNHKNYNDLLAVKEIVDQIPDRLSLFAFELHKQLGDARFNNAFYLVINEYIGKYGELVDSNSSLEEFNNKLVTPLLYKVHNEFKNRPHAEEIIMLCKKGRVKLNDVKQNITQILIDLKKVENKMSESIQILNETTSRINNMP